MICSVSVLSSNPCTIRLSHVANARKQRSRCPPLRFSTVPQRSLPTLLHLHDGQARLAAATALFMLPTAFVFPALLRMVNTPPTSVTLTKRRRFLQLRSQEHSKANDLSDSDEEEKSQDDPDPAAEFGHMLELGEFSHCGDVPTLPTEIHTAFMRTITWRIGEEVRADNSLDARNSRDVQDVITNLSYSKRAWHCCTTILSTSRSDDKASSCPWLRVCFRTIS